MSDKAEKKPAAAPAEGAEKTESAPKAAGMMAKTPVLIGGVMLLEALVLFAGFKFIGGGSPAPAVGATLTTGEEHGGSGEHGEGGPAVDPRQTVEIPLVAFKAPNKLSGRTFLYDVSIYVSVKGEHQKTVEETIKAKDALVQDRVRTIIAQSDPEKLGGGSEPGLETLRRQVKHQLDEILPEGMIVEVLIPRCIPYRADY